MKTCPACGAKVPDETEACPQCGGVWQADGGFDPNACFAGVGSEIKSVTACEPEKYDHAATVASACKRCHAGMVYGTIGLVAGILFWLLVTFGEPYVTLGVPVLALVGIVLSAVGRSRAERGRAAEDLATAGLACSIASIIIVFAIALILIVGALGITVG